MTGAPPPTERAADFRSDTVTRPSSAMRRAMAEAEVGDDVFADDPTVKRLEQEVAALFEREAALFVPSGSQGNQIAARLLAGPGEEVALGQTSHSFDWELAALAALSGLQARPLPEQRGSIDPEAVRRTLRPAGGFRPACRLLIVENTHNFHGGAVVPLAHLETLRQIAREKDARVHLDGARLWNAAVATGTPLAAYGRVADTIMCCFSKGLGAPVGSILVGDADRMAQAREVRKMLGGGMRQAGVLAAPARIALHDNRDRLADDHRRARALAEGLVANEGVELRFAPVETNIVFVRLPAGDAPRVREALAAEGVLAIATAPDTLRFVTHLDVDDDDVARAVGAFGAALRQAA